MRQLILDYGKSYEVRVEMLLVITAFINLFKVFMLLMEIFVYKTNNVYNIALNIMDMIILFVALMIMMYKTSIINEHFRIHKALLAESRAII